MAEKLCRVIKVTALVIVFFWLVLILASCSPSFEVDSNGVRSYNPEQLARATATVSAVQIQRANAELDLAIRQQSAQAELDDKRARAEVQRSVIAAKGQAEIQTELAVGHVKSQTLYALGTSASIAFVIVSVLGALAFVVWVTGRSVSRAYNDILNAQYVKIGVEPITLLPPPFVITRDGFLIDTRSGERARLRDSAGVNRLKLTATTQTTNVALLARAASDIGKANRGGQSGGGTPAADILPGIAASVPLLDTVEKNQ